MFTFGGASSLESLGRVPNGSGRLAPLQNSSLGEANGDPRVGPLVISEVQYNAGEPTAAALALYPDLNSGDLEFIELHNPTAGAVDLTDWRIRGGVDLNFDDATSIDAGETFVVVSFNPDNPVNAGRVAAFQEFYGIPGTVRLVGGYGGQLSDSSDRIELQRAERPIPGLPSAIAHVTEDEVLYDDSAPWSTSADGMGSTLHRDSAQSYGNDVTSWTAAGASPGSVSFDGVPSGDLNGDGSINALDIDALYTAINANMTDEKYDLDSSGTVDDADATYLVENILGTFGGDANLDGTVNAADLNQVGLNWLSDTNVGWASGDFNGDGTVNAQDLNIVGINWLQGAAAARAPRAPLSAVSTLPSSSIQAIDQALVQFESEVGTRFSAASVEEASVANDARPVFESAMAKRRWTRVAGSGSVAQSHQADNEGDSDHELKRLDDLFADLY